jgi:hypothetical protein
VLGILAMVDIAKEPASKRLKFSLKKKGGFPKYAALTMVAVGLLAWLIKSRGVIVQNCH